MGDRSSPTNHVADGIVAHTDNMQAISSQFWLIQEYDEQDRIKPYTCPTAIRVPLGREAVGKRGRADAPLPYQPDCRVRNNSSIVQEFSSPLRVKGGSLTFPVFQKTDDLGPFSQAGLVLDAPLDVTITLAGQGSQPIVTSFLVSVLSGMAKRISIPIPNGAKVAKIELSTKAGNGCFGTMVQPKTMKGSSYGSVGAGGALDVDETAQLYMHM